MKKTTSFLLLAAATFGSTTQALAQSGGTHHANVIYSQAGVALTISNTEVAQGTGTATYRWHRNGLPIPHTADNPTNEISYTVPVGQAVGCNQRFQRKVTMSGTVCDGPAEGWSNTVEVSFCATWDGDRCGNCLADDILCSQAGGFQLGNTCWARFDVGASRAFATDHVRTSARFYQFNRTAAFAVGDMSTNVTGSSYQQPSGWQSLPPLNGDWNEESRPVCPAGWRLPTRAEWQDLHNLSVPQGGTFVNTSEEYALRGLPQIPGRYYGPRSGVCGSEDFSGCFFFPIIGYRLAAALANNTTNECRFYFSNQATWHGGQAGSHCFWSGQNIYWTATESGSDAQVMILTSTKSASGSTPASTFAKLGGALVRCVQDRVQ